MSTRRGWRHVTGPHCWRYFVWLVGLFWHLGKHLGHPCGEILWEYFICWSSWMMWGGLVLVCLALLPGVSVSLWQSVSESPSLWCHSGAPVASQPAELTFPHGAHLCVRPGPGRFPVSRLVQRLHAAVDVVASCGLLVDSGPQHLPLHNRETTARDFWASCPEEAETAGLDCFGAGVGGVNLAFLIPVLIYTTHVHGNTTASTSLALNEVLPQVLMVCTNLATLHALTKHIPAVTSGGECGAMQGELDKRVHRAKSSSCDHVPGVAFCGLLDAAGCCGDMLQPRWGTPRWRPAECGPFLCLAVCRVQSHGGGPGTRPAKAENHEHDTGVVWSS